MSVSSRRARAAGVAIVALVVSSWGADVGASSARSVPGSTAKASGLGAGDGASRPNTAGRAVHDLYDPVLAPMGLRVTRATLYSGADRVKPDPAGTHLAIYATSSQVLAPDRYVANLVDLASLFAGDVFDRWSGVESFDVCQEILDRPDGSGSEAGRTVTVFQISRVGAVREAGQRFTLERLMVLSRLSDGGVSLSIAEPASTSRLWRDAVIATETVTTGTSRRAGY